MFLKNEILSDIITKLVMTNDFLPFMILPIYSVIIKIDKSLSEASLDLEQHVFRHSQRSSSRLAPWRYIGNTDGFHAVADFLYDSGYSE